MSHKRLFISAAIIALVIGASFALSVPHTRDIDRLTAPAAEDVGVPVVVVRDSFKKGVHTITGSLEVPNACVSVTARAALLDSAPDTASILLELSMLEETGICLQVPTRMSFSATVAASARLPITVTVNGSVATTTGL